MHPQPSSVGQDIIMTRRTTELKLGDNLHPQPSSVGQDIIMTRRTTELKLGDNLVANPQILKNEHIKAHSVIDEHAGELDESRNDTVGPKCIYNRSQSLEQFYSQFKKQKDDAKKDKLPLAEVLFASGVGTSVSATENARVQTLIMNSKNFNKLAAGSLPVNPPSETSGNGDDRVECDSKNDKVQPEVENLNGSRRSCSYRPSVSQSVRNFVKLVPTVLAMMCFCFLQVNSAYEACFIATLLILTVLSTQEEFQETICCIATLIARLGGQMYAYVACRARNIARHSTHFLKEVVYAGTWCAAKLWLLMLKLAPLIWHITVRIAWGCNIALLGFLLPWGLRLLWWIVERVPGATRSLFGLLHGLGGIVVTCITMLVAALSAHSPTVLGYANAGVDIAVRYALGNISTLNVDIFHERVGYVYAATQEQKNNPERASDEERNGNKVVVQQALALKSTAPTGERSTEAKDGETTSDTQQNDQTQQSQNSQTNSGGSGCCTGVASGGCARAGGCGQGNDDDDDDKKNRKRKPIFKPSDGGAASSDNKKSQRKRKTSQSSKNNLLKEADAVVEKNAEPIEKTLSSIGVLRSMDTIPSSKMPLKKNAMPVSSKIKVPWSTNKKAARPLEMRSSAKPVSVVTRRLASTDGRFTFGMDRPEIQLYQLIQFMRQPSVLGANFKTILRPHVQTTATIQQLTGRQMSHNAFGTPAVNTVGIACSHPFFMQLFQAPVVKVLLENLLSLVQGVGFPSTTFCIDFNIAATPGFYQTSPVAPGSLQSAVVSVSMAYAELRVKILCFEVNECQRIITASGITGISYQYSQGIVAPRGNGIQDFQGAVAGTITTREPVSVSLACLMLLKMRVGSMDFTLQIRGSSHLGMLPASGQQYMHALSVGSGSADYKAGRFIMSQFITKIREKPFLLTSSQPRMLPLKETCRPTMANTPASSPTPAGILNQVMHGIPRKQFQAMNGASGQQRLIHTKPRLARKGGAATAPKSLQPNKTPAKVHHPSLVKTHAQTGALRKYDPLLHLHPDSSSTTMIAMTCLQVAKKTGMHQESLLHFEAELAQKPQTRIMHDVLQHSDVAGKASGQAALGSGSGMPPTPWPPDHPTSMEDHQTKGDAKPPRLEPAGEASQRRGQTTQLGEQMERRMTNSKAGPGLQRSTQMFLDPVVPPPGCSGFEFPIPGGQATRCLLHGSLGDPRNRPKGPDLEQPPASPEQVLQYSKPPPIQCSEDLWLAAEAGKLPTAASTGTVPEAGEATNNAVLPRPNPVQFRMRDRVSLFAVCEDDIKNSPREPGLDDGGTARGGAVHLHPIQAERLRRLLAEGHPDEADRFRRLLQERQNLLRPYLCHFCFTHRFEVLLQPCNHMLCALCADLAQVAIQRPCPICDDRVDEIVPIRFN